MRQCRDCINFLHVIDAGMAQAIPGYCKLRGRPILDEREKGCGRRARYFVERGRPYVITFAEERT